MVRSLAAVIAILSLQSFVRGQDPVGAVRGVVTDKDFGAPIAGVEVALLETRLTARTSEQGTFVLRDVPPGRYTVAFAKDGYTRQLRPDVVVESGRMAEVSVALVGDFESMEEVVVRDTLRPDSGTESSLLQIRLESPALLDAISAELMSRAGVSDAASALRLVSGASVQDGKSAVIRGLPDRYVSNQMNGVRLPTADEDKRAVELDQFPTEVIESIQVSKTFTPDQQGDASGGAVDVRLKGIPKEPFFVRVKAQVGHNSQATGRRDFPTYEGGGVGFWGRDDSRKIQYENLGDSWDGAVGVSTGQAPPEWKYAGAIGGQMEIADGLRLGALVSMFHERETSFYRNGRDDSWWVETPGAPMTPKTLQGTVQDGNFKTALYDVDRGSQSVQWGTLSTIGLATEAHSINLTWLYTHSAEDTATLAEDTRGKHYFFPGHDPDNQNSPGHANADAAPYLRLETLEYTERTTDTLQLGGVHKIDLELLGTDRAPELDWIVARSSADMDQPDKRQFGSLWKPGRQAGPLNLPATFSGLKPSDNLNVGNVQRIFKTIKEDSDTYAVNLKVPFEPWDELPGYVKFGVFRDKVERRFDQETFSNAGETPEPTFAAPWEQSWSASWPFQSHPIVESPYDVDYRGDQRIEAVYGMIDLPIVSGLNLIGGVRAEKTRVAIANDPDPSAVWFPPGSNGTPTQINPGDADVDFHQHDLLPAIALTFTPIDPLTLRASYTETVARQTFKELSPIQQQEYLGGPIFIGNPDLEMSSLRNVDLRADYQPLEGSLLSASWFHKDVYGAIEYVQQITTFDYTTAVNYPRGEIDGWEFEARQALGKVWSALDGLTAGGNVTLLDSFVRLPDDEVLAFSAPDIAAPMSTREMTNAPDYLYNLFCTYDIAATGTQLALFYTVQGDTLVAGAGESNGNFVPSVYMEKFDTLNLSVAQALGSNVKLVFQAKNLTNPDIEQVYRSPYIGDDVTRSSYSNGIDFTFAITGEWRF